MLKNIFLLLKIKMKLMNTSPSIAFAMTLFYFPCYADEIDIGAPTTTEEKVITNFYGRLNISLQSSDESDVKFNELKSNASRIGVKGSYNLEHGLVAIYTLDWIVRKDSLTARDQWLGIKGSLGEITLGRAETTLKVSQGKFDLFNTYEGDLRHLFIGENRVNDSITYKSITYNNIRFLGSLLVSKNRDLDTPLALGIAWGDADLKKTDFFVAMAREKNMQGDKAIYNTTRITSMYQLNNLRLGTIFTQSEITNSDEASLNGESQTGYALNLSYTLGKLLPKAQLQEFSGATAMNFGIDYKLAKEAKVYAWYTDREGLSFNGQTIKEATAGRYIGVGMEITL